MRVSVDSQETVLPAPNIYKRTVHLAKGDAIFFPRRHVTCRCGLYLSSYMDSRPILVQCTYDTPWYLWRITGVYVVVGMGNLLRTPPASSATIQQT